MAKLDHLSFQVDDVAATYEKLARAGVRFECPPSKRFRGFGAELRDPDGVPGVPLGRAVDAGAGR